MSWSSCIGNLAFEGEIEASGDGTHSSMNFCRLLVVPKDITDPISDDISAEDGVFHSLPNGVKLSKLLAWQIPTAGVVHPISARIAGE